MITPLFPAMIPALAPAAPQPQFGSEFEIYISYNAPMHLRHRQTDTDIVA